MFLAFAILVGIVSAPVQAASRSLLARIAPPDKITQYFGLFAFSGKVTAFLAPFFVAMGGHHGPLSQRGAAQLRQRRGRIFKPLLERP